MNRIPKGFYLGSMAAGWGSYVLVTTIAALTSKQETVATSGEKGGILVGLASLAMLYSSVIGLIVWYKAWASIQDGNARTTPGKAIGFLFIPLFNLYWMFQAIWGFSKDYNSYVQRHQIGVTSLPEGLFLASCVLPFVGLIPILGVLAGIAEFIVVIMVVLKVIDGVNALPEGGPMPAAQRAFPVGTPPTNP